ncbi:FERM, ARHGEF and pleckstrin domain-containing protein 2 isoform X2 [Delphinapterus leucas]|uniref:FERM, ARHGEF and pleckstrin domain-containing protein 2 n=1 Tax=Delphinapterus leucas TaxID=9749 RepID=A0A2Y9MXZ5_DELLE|nr:FERM, ARHGEF and pleckstrin domain-containing protein 2 isoform X2 [Delphinapterus leucas]
MGELEGTYRVLQTPGTRLGAQTPAGVSTLEPGHGPSAAAAWPAARTPIRVQLLDSSVEVFDVEPKCYGQVLLTQVWKRLNLIECDYFGLEFQNVQSCWIWLEPMKPIVRQVRRPKNTVLRLAVKFFPPDPGQLQEEYTRYLFALQLKRDLLEERLTCTDTTAALLASHLLQAEIGDYEEALVREHLRAHEYLPGQERALERILELHRGHAGQTPAESDFQVLEIARKLEMYGIRFHMASDREGTKINLAVSHMGVLVFQSSTKINTFNWSRLRKLSFKRKRFLIKLHPEVHGPYQDTLEFVLGSRDACKNFWKTCVEYHTFFRLSDQPKPRARAILFSRGSSFRYSGRTQKQLVDYVKDGGMKRIPYERKHSKTQMSLRALNANLPRQSILFTEGTRTPASPSSTSASFCSGPASPPAPVGLLGSKDSSSSPTGPPAPSARWPAAERSGVAAAPPPGPPAFQPCQGLSVESPQLPSTRKTPPSLSPLGPAEQGSSPLLSPVLSDAGGAGMDDQEELRHKCAPADEAYFIAKEILATERTYLKDLEVITVWFRSAVVKADAMPADLMTLLFSNVDPIYEFHRGFLREVEQRLALWEGSSSAQATGDHRRIGDVLLSNMLQLKALTRHFQRLHEVLTELEAASRRLRRLEALRRDFELQKVCYLPLNAFLLKPLQRLRHYRLLLRRLCAPDRQDPGQDPDRGDQDRADRREALKAITEVTSTLQHSLVRLENLQKLMELQRDLVGIENLIAPGREFIREGCLHKLTRKGLQQRMFFLFSDMLLYTGRGASGTSHFRIRGLLPLRGMLVEERENEWSVPHCFTIYAAQKTVVVAASTQLEKEKWMRDLNAAIDAAKSNADTALAPLGSVLCPHPRRPSDEVSLEESEDDARRARCSSGGPGQHRASTAMHVCWDRTTSISRADRSAAVENQLSGYLLRKFKNSSGWQKLWVVFTNFCLFFYKTHQVGVLHRARGGLCPWHCRTARPAHCALTEPPRFRTSLAPPLLPCGERRGAGRLASACPAAFQDDCPLASLPLLGYSVSLPGEADGIHKEHVFKLQFKSHVYFFRAESKYTLGRWMEVIESASTSPGRAGTSEEEA